MRTKTEEEKRQKRLEKNKRYYYKHRGDILKKQAIYQHSKRSKTNEELSSLGKDPFGRFKKTNGNQRYKQCQVNGRRIGKHIAIWEKHNNIKVPKGFVIHHKDGNKINNKIENLELKKLSDHTKEYFKEYYKNNSVWNKDLPKEKQPNYGRRYKFKESSKRKQKCSWFNKYLQSNIEIWKRKDLGLTPTQISKELNLTIHNVNHRWKGFQKVINTNSGRLI